MVRTGYLNNGIKPESFSEYFRNYPNIFINNLGIFPQFICGVIGLIVAMKYIHKRKFLTLITVNSKLKLSNIVKSTIVYFILRMIVDLTYSYVNDNPIHFECNLSEYLLFFFVTIFFTAIQICFDEFFNRGFLFQNLVFYFRYPVIALFLTSFIFASAHLQSLEYFIFYFFTALLFCLITILSNSLELAIGIHFMHNIFSSILTDDNLEKSLFYHNENPENKFVWLLPLLIFFILSIFVFGIDKLKSLFKKESKIK